MLRRYSELFGIGEIAVSKRLQAVFWALWGLCILDLNEIGFFPSRTWRLPPCWEHFQNCYDYIQIGSLPFSYNYTLLTAALLAFLFGGALGAIKKKWEVAHFALLVVIIFKLIWSMVIFDYGTSNFEYFHLVPAIGFLLARNKLSQMRYLWAFVYFFTPFVKLDTGWIIGTYFTSLKIGLPIFPDALIPLITNGVIVFEMLASIGLISKNKRIAQISLYGWTIFHLYSTILVGFFYPVRCLAMLWALFGFREENEPALRQPLLEKKNWAMVVLIAYITFASLFPSFISASPNDTFEGMNYGLHMFNSNHQCLNIVTHLDAQGTQIRREEFGTTNAMTRCYPQWTLQRLHKLCGNESGKISWQFYHSKDGGPFYELVNVPDVCQIEYKAFAHNEWIKAPSQGAEIKGYPEPNSIFARDGGPPPVIHETPQRQFGAVQTWLQEAFPHLKAIYFSMWTLLFVYILKIYFVDRFLRHSKH